MAEETMYQPSPMPAYASPKQYETSASPTRFVSQDNRNESNTSWQVHNVGGNQIEIPAGTQVLSSKTTEVMMKIPKRIIREEILEENVIVKETVMEIAKPIYQEKIVEVPEIEYRDKIKEVVERVIEEKIKEVPKIEYCERIIEVPKYVTQEKIVTIPQIEYRDVVHDKLIEVPEVHQNLTVKEIRVPSYVDEQGQPIEQPTITVERKIPVPMEAVTTYEYQLAQLRPRVTKVQYPMYVPRFIPVPVVAETLETEKAAAMQELVNNVGKLISPQAVGLREVDELRTQAIDLDFANQLPTHEKAEQVIRSKWLSGELQVSDSRLQTKQM